MSGKDDVLVGKLEVASLAGESDGIVRHLVKFVTVEYEKEDWVRAAIMCKDFDMIQSHDWIMRNVRGVFS